MDVCINPLNIPVEKRFDKIANITRKRDYDVLVKCYRSLVQPQSFLLNEGNAPAYSFSTLSSTDPLSVLSYMDTPDMSDVNRLVENWVRLFVTAIWSFTEQPFSISNYSINDQVVNEYYSLLTDILRLRLGNKETGFKTALVNVVREWFETGTGVILFEKVDKYFTLNSIPPENIQYLLDERGSCYYAIIRETKLTFDENGNETTVYKYTEFFREDDDVSTEKIFAEIPKVSWTVFHFEVHNNGTTSRSLADPQQINYNPLFFIFFQKKVNSLTGYGRGLEALPLLTNVNNIQKNLNELADTLINPKFIVNTGGVGHQDVEKYKESFMVSKTADFFKADSLKVESAGASVAIHEPVQYYHDANLAVALKNEYVARIRELFSPNSMFASKGIARMTAQEANIRNEYDKIEITHLTATVLDDFIIPLIKRLFSDLLTERNDNIPKPQSYGLSDLRKFVVTIENVKNDEDNKKRLIELSDSIAVIKQIAEVSQALGFDTTATLSEINNMMNLHLRQQPSESLGVPDILTDLLNSNVRGANEV